jgi:hypothetical protein
VLGEYSTCCLFPARIALLIDVIVYPSQRRRGGELILAIMNQNLHLLHRDFWLGNALFTILIARGLETNYLLFPVPVLVLVGGVDECEPAFCFGQSTPLAAFL